MNPVRSGGEISYAVERLLVKAVEVIYDDRTVLLPGFETIRPDRIKPFYVNCPRNERVNSLQIFITRFSFRIRCRPI